MADDEAREDVAAPEDADGAVDDADDDAPVEELHGVPCTSSRGQVVLHPSREQLVELVQRLRDEEQHTICVELTAVDYLTYDAPRDLPPSVTPERFEVVVGLMSMARHERLRLRVQVPESDPVCPSLFDVHPGTEALEREVFDMFGIRFEGHPDLTRILMPEDWEGHPLRKDYPVGKIPVQFKAATNVR